MGGRIFNKQKAAAVIEDFVCNPGKTYKGIATDQGVSVFAVYKYLNKYYGKGEKPQVRFSKI